VGEAKNLPWGTVVLGGLFLLLMLITYVLVKPPPPPPELAGILRSEYRQIPAFELQTGDGQRFDKKSFKGKWSFVFFGYTSCPDVCPLTLHVLDSVQRRVKDENGGDTVNIQVIFVSVDPQRDTLEKLRKYVRYFNRRFIAVTSSKRIIENFSAQFGASYVIEPETAPGQYIVDHVSAIYLVDPLGRLVAVFSQPHYANTIFTQFERVKSYFSSAL